MIWYRLLICIFILGTHLASADNQFDARRTDPTLPLKVKVSDRTFDLNQVKSKLLQINSNSIPSEMENAILRTFMPLFDQDDSDMIGFRIGADFLDARVKAGDDELLFEFLSKQSAVQPINPSRLESAMLKINTPSQLRLLPIFYSNAYILEFIVPKVLPTIWKEVVFGGASKEELLAFFINDSRVRRIPMPIADTYVQAIYDKRTDIMRMIEGTPKFKAQIKTRRVRNIVKQALKKDPSLRPPSKPWYQRIVASTNCCKF